VGVVIGVSGSQNSMELFGIPLFAFCGFLIFTVQWLAFVPAYWFQTEGFFDLTGSVTYVTVIIVVCFTPGIHLVNAVFLGVLVAIWAFRLGTFLFLRLHRKGFDSRFIDIKPDPLRFFMVWTLQGLWVLVTFAAGLAAMTSNRALFYTPVTVAGAVIWLGGFVVEVIADLQKKTFRSDPKSQGLFIMSGLWLFSRHPNYVGEITLWFGIALIASPVLRDWQFVTLVSPIFVWILLRWVSGVPMLEAQADQNWGENPEYRQYKESTPVLFPNPYRMVKALFSEFSR
tara:strand:- start:2491 stop:3345 length:855 start_codon:yes stop_codon:yes gene_type:complete